VARARWRNCVESLITLACFSSGQGHPRAACQVHPEPERRRIEFLFAPAPDGKGIVLKRGVAWCLQEFYDLLQSQVRAGWVEQVRSISRNSLLIGGHKDLEEFLFGQQRMTLGRIRERLVDLEGPTCFYCEKTMDHVIEVDHFVPWSRYPHDRGTTSCWPTRPATTASATPLPAGTTWSDGWRVSTTRRCRFPMRCPTCSCAMRQVPRRWRSGLLARDPCGGRVLGRRRGAFAGVPAGG